MMKKELNVPGAARRKVDALNDVAPIIRLWVLRILVPLGGHSRFVSERGFTSDAIAKTAGLTSWLKTGTRTFNSKLAVGDLRTLFDAVETKHAAVTVPTVLRKNVACLAKLVGLSDVDCRILEFAVLVHSDCILDDAADLLGDLSSVKVMHALSVILAIPSLQLRAAFSAEGLLTRSGLVTLDTGRRDTLRCKLDLLSEHFPDHLQSTIANPISLLRAAVSPSAPASLTLRDFRHTPDIESLLLPYLKQATKTSRKGVNIFIYGPPGTGKTELARVLAAAVGVRLFQVASEDEDGDAINGIRRLRAHRAGQCILGAHSSLVVFDEVEDIFNDGNGLFGVRSTAQSHKAWMNRSLEENAVPTIWLSNAISGLDPAFVRRFDMVIELPVPPRRQRQDIIAQLCADMIDVSTMSLIAEAENLAPAVVARVASVVDSIRADLTPAATNAAVTRLISGTLAVQGHRRLSPIGSQLPALYDPALVRCDADLTTLAAGLRETGAGRLCLYGPPGTGKTAFGKWLAEEIGVPLDVVRASDLLSKYVGGTEQNISNAFEKATAAGALLLIDEVDSFLQDRRGAQRSWEVTAVNEMLTQIESFAGLLVVSTNLMDNLDQAALRRFDIKLKFGFLDDAQSVTLLRRYCVALGIAKADSDTIEFTRPLRNLTPGDFSAVGRQHLFRRFDTVTAFVQALETECAMKSGTATTAIGFY